MRDRGYDHRPGAIGTSPVRTSLGRLGAPTAGELQRSGGGRGRRIPKYVQDFLSFLPSNNLSTSRRSSKLNRQSPATIWETRLDRADSRCGLRHAPSSLVFDDGDFLVAARPGGRSPATRVGRADRWCGGQPAHAHVGGDRQLGRPTKTALVHPVLATFDIPLKLFVVDTQGFARGGTGKRFWIIQARPGGSCTRWSRLMCRKVTITIRRVLRRCLRGDGGPSG